MLLIRNITANYISQFYVMLIGILMLPVYIRYIGVETYGLVGFFVMLRDIQAGRAPEIEAIIGAITELGQLTGKPCLSVNPVYARARLLDLTMQQSGLA